MNNNIIQATPPNINEHGPDWTWTWNEDQHPHQAQKYDMPRLSTVVVDLISSADLLNCNTKENRIIFLSLRQLPHSLDKMKTYSNTNAPTHPSNVTSMVK